MSVVRWVASGVLLSGTMVVASLAAGPGDGSRCAAWLAQRRGPCRVGAGVPGVHARADLGAARRRVVAEAKIGLRTGDAEILRSLARENATAIEWTGAAQDLVRRLQPVAAAVRAAARAGSIVDRVAIEGGDDAIVLDAAIDLVIARARRADVEGDLSGAAAALLDGLVVATGLVQCGSAYEQVVGFHAASRCLGAFGDDLLGRCDDALLATIATSLECIDAAFPVRTRVVEAAAVDVLTRLADPTAGCGDLGVTPLQAWRHAFSPRRAAMQRASRWVSAAQRLARTSCDLPWSERRRELETIVVALRDPAGPVDPLLEQLVQHEERQRDAVARLRLLRLAVAFHRGSPPPGLDDPLGDGRLRVESGAVDATFASAAPGLFRRARRR